MIATPPRDSSFASAGSNTPLLRSQRLVQNSALSCSSSSSSSRDYHHHHHHRCFPVAPSPSSSESSPTRCCYRRCSDRTDTYPRTCNCSASLSYKTDTSRSLRVGRRSHRARTCTRVSRTRRRGRICTRWCYYYYSWYSSQLEKKEDEEDPSSSEKETKSVVLFFEENASEIFSFSSDVRFAQISTTKENIVRWCLLEEKASR